MRSSADHAATTWSWLLSMVAIVLLGACDSEICARHSDCVSGQVCSASGACAIAPDDASPSDSSDGGSDAVVIDAAPDATTDATLDGGP